MKTLDYCDWSSSDYGLYLRGMNGVLEDTDKQLWWCIYVNGESATVGADDIMLKDGDTYTATYTQGW